MEEEMTQAAEKLDFETAARLRDQVVKLRSEIEDNSQEDVLGKLKSQARKGSSYGKKRRR